MIITTTVAVILTALRASMVRENIAAYIVPSEDEHYTEFVADCHLRKAYISNFTGSAGTAIVTADEALIWTDGRYYTQAEQELDSEYWTLMRDGMPDVPSQAQWLIDNLTPHSSVGVDWALFTKGSWDSLENQLTPRNLTLVGVDVNLVDEVWEIDGKPPCSSNDIFSLGLEFAGKSSAEKVRDVRMEMTDNDASVLLVTELDEVAWLLNLRGRDIPSSSTFFAFLVITQTTFDFFVDRSRVNSSVLVTLQNNIPEIQIQSYENVYAEFPQIIEANPTGMVWVNRNANYKLVKAVTDIDPDRLLIKLTPISLMKSIKNDVEVTGYRRALIRDSAALCEFFAWLEDSMENGEPVTEISAATHLYQIRQNRSNLFFDQSFPTISASGENAAIIHYMPTEQSSRPLSRDDIYLVDSGALYYDGTTDITRTISFGNGSATPFIKEAYTRVLKGQIGLATAKFPTKTVGNRLDSYAREFLWEAGLDYQHGTGHGIGSFLNIHEGPQGIGSGYRDDPGLQESMFTSNEPGYYDVAHGFGIRLENVIRVEKVNLTNDFQNSGYLGFEDLTWVPYQHNLIEFSILTEDEILYLNEYQEKTRQIVGAYLEDPANNFPQSAFDWMMRETEPIVKTTSPTEEPSSTTVVISTSTPTPTTTVTPTTTTSTTTTTTPIPTTTLPPPTPLRDIRNSMMRNGISAYIIPAEDEHYTEFVAECHQRRAYISKFTGSAGTAIVTLGGQALLWTDGRYYFQARQELDLRFWTLMEDGMPDTPSQAQWLIANLPPFSHVGVDASLFSKGKWDEISSQLTAGNLTLVEVDGNLVDEIWEEDGKPPCSSNAIFNLGSEFAGKNSSEKVRDVRKEMADNDASVLLVTELDEVAWLLNLRGKDIPSSSTFFSFVVLTQTTFNFFVNPAQVNASVLAILRSNIPELNLRNYSNVYQEFPQVIAANPSGLVWVNRNANYKLVKAVTDVNTDRLLIKLTPISLMKSIKNDVEVEGFRRGLIRDSAALCEFYSWLEDSMERGQLVTETSAAAKVYEIRQNRSALFFDKSFSTISATGVNAAVIHYMPTEQSSRNLSTEELYLVDSGALYYDSTTTDITRTFSFGTPTNFQKEAYTRVLKGQIALVTAKFPNKTVGHRLDSYARQALWEVGLDYNHGTGHGIGAFLNIHEGPQNIGFGYRMDDPGLQANMITSNEPGYYDEVEGFGIRLENVIRVVEADLPNNYQNTSYLTFEDLVFVPYQHKLIDFSILTDTEIEYLNNYQEQTRRIVGGYLQDPANNFPPSAYEWMMRETMPIGETSPTSTIPPTSSSSSTEEPSTSTTQRQNGAGWLRSGALEMSIQLILFSIASIIL